MALCESVGRKEAGGGDESAARVDAMDEQPVKHGNFVSDLSRPSGEEMKQNYLGRDYADGTFFLSWKTTSHYGEG